MASPHPAAVTPASARTSDDPKREAGSSEGMSAVTPRKRHAQQDEPETLRDPADIGLPLPHERDQSTAMTGQQPDAQVQQASRDLGRGLQDTDKGVPMDKIYDKLKQR